MMRILPKPIPHHLMEQIRRDIILGHHPPGGALREQALQAEYGCSRAPIREALHLLAHRGLVTHAPRHGFRVRRVDAVEVRQIYELRALLERHVVEGLVGRVTPPLLAALRAANAEVRRQREAGDVERYIEANIAFHAILRAHAPNDPLDRAMQVVLEVAEPLRHALLMRSLRTSRATEQHEEIIALLAEGRVADAAAAMHAHVFTGMPSALEIVENLRADETG